MEKEGERTNLNLNAWQKIWTVVVCVTITGIVYIYQFEMNKAFMLSYLWMLWTFGNVRPKFDVIVYYEDVKGLCF